MSQSISAKIFVSRRHALLVRLPIGALVLLGVLEVLARRERWKSKVWLDRPAFAAVVQPILQQRCVACHGPEKHKADLRLDSFEVLLKGGQDGPVLKTSNAAQSPLLQRILLPLDGDGHMPPEGEPQITAQETSLLEWWINAGAPATATIADLKPAPKIRSLMKAIPRRIQ